MRFRPSIRARNTATCAAVAALLSLAVALPAATAAPPANDAFASAQPIEGTSGVVSGSNVEATRESDEPRHAGNAGGRSVWYRWTAPATTEFAFDTCGSGFDTLLAVYTGTAVDALSPVAANDDACAEQSIVLVRATAGVVYSIALDGYREDEAAETGRFTLRWEIVTRPSNDDFDSAQELTGSAGAVRGANLGAGAENGEPPHGDSIGASIWYRWTAPSGGTATFATCGSAFDTIIAVYTGDGVSRLTPVARNDNACGSQSRVRFVARAGVVYRIAVDGTGDRPRGVATLSWSLVPRPPNDDFNAARRISGARGSISASTEGALAEPSEPEHASYSADTSVWYVWRAPRTMGITFETCQAAFDTVISVYRGRALRRLVVVDEDDDGCPTDHEAGSRVDFLARKGVDYRIAVDGTHESGAFVLSWRPAGPSAEPCRVPDVRGLTLRRARAVLERADCRVGQVAYSSSAIVPAGRVIAQFPPPGTRLRFLSRVALEISRGRPR
jgi:hypothetical protein